MCENLLCFRSTEKPVRLSESQNLHAVCFMKQLHVQQFAHAKFRMSAIVCGTKYFAS